MRWIYSGLVSAAVMLSAGCRSKYIQATLTNGSGAPLHGLQVDYPSASFGTQELAPGQVFHYRFKLLGTGPVKVTFTDAKMREHTQTGPELLEGEEGALGIDFAAQDRAEFRVSVHP